MEVMKITDMTAIANTLLTLLNILLTVYIVIYAKLQFKEAGRARQITAFPSLKHIRSPKSAGERARIYQAYVENPERFRSREDLSQDQELHTLCKEIVYSMSEIGILIHHRLLDPMLVKDWLRDIPAKLWIVLRQYVKEGEGRRGQDYYGVAFKKVAELGLESWLESYMRLPHAELLIFHSDDRTKNKKFSREKLEYILREIRRDLRDFGWIVN